MNQTDKKEYKTKIFKVHELKQVKTQTTIPKFIVRQPEDIAKFFIDEIDVSDRDKFIIAFLNTKNVVVGYEIVAIGNLGEVQVHPREVFKSAILNNASRIIVGNYQTSRIRTPSTETFDAMKQIREAGEIIGIKLFDHIVFGDENFISLKELGYL